jgi:hypothetical protein
MYLSLMRNIAEDKDVIPYFVCVDLSTEVVAPNPVFRLPVYWQRTDGRGSLIKERYNVEVCGFRIETGNIHQIVRLVEQLLPGLINMARLPTYIFIARRSRRMYPVYTIEDEVFVTTPGGPVFRHVELANVRRYLSEYLHEMGELGTPGKSETLHVRGVHTGSLALIRPVFYLKKRIPDENEFWAPVFPSLSGRMIYTYAASARREVEITGDQEVLALQDVVARALMADRRLKDKYDLRPDRLMPDYWARLRVTLTPEPLKLEVFDNNGTANGAKIDLYRSGGLQIAVETRSDENRFGLFLGRDTSDLRDRVARDYLRRGLIGSLESVRILPVRQKAQRVSMLDRVLAGTA